MNLLAFDLGASSGKLYLMAVEGEQVETATVHRFANRSYTLHGSLYWDIFHIVDELHKGIRKAVRLTGDRIDSLGIDTFCNDFALLAGDGELLAPVRCYRDPRAGRYAQTIYETMSQKTLHEMTGNQNAPFNTLMQLAAMRHSGTGFLLEQCERLLLLPDYLAWLLTEVSAAEFSVASVSQLYNCRTQAWSNEIPRAFGIPQRILQRIVMPGTVLGPTAADTDRLLGTKGFAVTAVCGHDTASAFLTSRALPEEHVTVSCGTWALIGAELGAPLVNADTLRLGFANEGGFGGVYRLSHNVMGLWLLQESKKSFETRGQTYSYDELDKLCMQAEPFTYSMNADDSRLYQPADMLGAIETCCAEHGAVPATPGEYVRCIYESLALRFSVCLRELETLTGKRYPVIHMIGGGAVSAPLCQFTADACGRRVVAGPADATAIGNAAAQMCALGLTPGPTEALAMFPMKTTGYLPGDSTPWQAARDRLSAAMPLQQL